MSQSFTSMPNFRELGSKNNLQNGNGNGNSKFTIDTDIVTEEFDCRGLKLYRSSRPDFLTTEEIDKFNKLGIRCIVDFRSATEYHKATGGKLLDDLYPVYKVKLPFRARYKPGEKISYIPIKKSVSNGNTVHKDEKISENGGSTGEAVEELNTNSNPADGGPVGKHILINFFKMQYIWAVYNRAPWYIKLYSMIFLFVDLVLRTGYRYFVRVFAYYVLNKEGLYGQYIDMIEHSQAAICAALKLLCEKENVPAMLNCAHGKDRTGIVSALVLACLGKSKHFIALDYSRSETELLPMQDRLYSEIVDRFHMCKSFTTAKYETMMKVLTYIDDTYGSVSNYLESLAFTKADQEKLRANLIDKINGGGSLTTVEDITSNK